MLESPFQTMFRHFWSEKNKMDTGVSFILLLSAAKRLTFCLILLKMTAYVLLLFSVFFPAIRSQNIPPIEDESDLWALVSVMSVFFTKAQIHSQKQNTIHAVISKLTFLRWLQCSVWVRHATMQAWTTSTVGSIQSGSPIQAFDLALLRQNSFIPHLTAIKIWDLYKDSFGGRIPLHED